MQRLLPPLVLRPTPPRLTLGLLLAAAILAVATVTAYPLERVAHTSYLGMLYLFCVEAISILWGLKVGAVAAVASALLWDYFRTPHLADFWLQPRDWVTLAIFLAVALLISSVADLARSRANEADARGQELRLLAEKQSALRRVAILVALGVSPTQLFAAVAEQMGEILGAEFIEIIRHGADRTFTVVGSWTHGESTLARPTGSRWPVEPGTVVPLLLRTGRPARINFGRDQDDGVIHKWVRDQGITSVVGCPIMVEGRQWGALFSQSTKAEPQPADTEERMQEFTELVATAIANTESRTELIASRARVVAAADETRRRIERDLHDGTQQRLISLAVNLQAAQAGTPPDQDELRAQLHQTAQGLADAMSELQEISRGIHPAILSSGGLAPALKTLARRCAVPVELTVHNNQRLPEPVEVAAYYIVSEALTNATKHAHASVVNITLDVADAILRLYVSDDGIGGANPDRGSGLTGLRDRVEAVGGTIEIASPAGRGTSLTVAIPIRNDLPVAHPAGRRCSLVVFEGSPHLVPMPVQPRIGPLPAMTSTRVRVTLGS